MFFVGILSIKYNERESKAKKPILENQTTLIIKYITWGKQLIMEKYVKSFNYRYRIKEL